MKACVTLIFAAASASLACAGSEPDACRVERSPVAKAVCLELIADQQFLKMSQQIDDVLSRLQAASSSELLQLDDQYRTAQLRWSQTVLEACTNRHAGDLVKTQTCRLSATSTRRAQLALSLQRAAEDFGAPAEYNAPIPDAVEVLVPLSVPLPFGAEARLPLLVPLYPD